MVSNSNDQHQPDLLDLIFKYIEEEFPDMKDRVTSLKTAARKEFSGMGMYIAQRPAAEREKTINEILTLFNGRNATEIARRLNISRATVYRTIKTAGK